MRFKRGYCMVRNNLKAIILAAGMGSRLANLTEAHTKSMVEVNGITMMERMLRQLDAVNLDEIVVVVGYKGQELITYIDSLNINTKVSYIDNDIYDSTNNIYSLYLAKDVMMESNILLLESDLIFEDALLERIVNEEQENAALVAKFEPWMDGTVVTLDDNNTIRQFIPKENFVYEDAENYYKTVNIYKFSKEFSSNFYVPFLKSYMDATGRGGYYERALELTPMFKDFHLHGTVVGDEHWYEVDDMQDLEIAEVMFEENVEKKLVKIQNKYGGYWRYPKLIDFCYLVNPFYPNDKILNEIKYNFERLVRDYPSGLGVNSRLAAKHFDIAEEHIIIGNGASELIKSIMEQLKGNIGLVLPTFEEYPNRIKDLNVVEYMSNENGYQYDADDLMNFYEDKDLTSLLLINPDNPTGNYITKDDVLRLVEWTKARNIDFILDESFIDFVGAEVDHTLLKRDIIADNPNLILIKSISKSYGVPGFRLGVLATSNGKWMDFVKADVSIWNINSFGEYYMQIIDKYKKDFKVAMDRFLEVRSDYVKELDEISFLKTIPSESNYIMCEVLPPYTSEEVTAILLAKYNIFIKDLTSKRGFGDGQFIRVAIKRPEENAALIHALREI